MEPDVADVRTRWKCPPPDCLKGQVRNEMTRHCAENPLAGVVVNVGRLALTTLAIVISGAFAWPQSSANAVAIPQGLHAAGTTGDHGPITIGNGKYNKNYSQVFSPTNMYGVQHVSSASVSGSVPSQSAFCKKRYRVCHISQKLWVSRRH
jgi:hypothetical protein